MTLRELLRNLKLKSTKIMLCIENGLTDKELCYMGTVGELLYWAHLNDYLDLIVGLIHTEKNSFAVWLTYE